MAQSLEEPDISEEKVDFDWDDEDVVVSNLTCVCIVGIEDPVRDEVSINSITSYYITMLINMNY